MDSVRFSLAGRTIQAPHRVVCTPFSGPRFQDVKVAVGYRTRANRDPTMVLAMLTVVRWFQGSGYGPSSICVLPPYGVLRSFKALKPEARVHYGER